MNQYNPYLSANAYQTADSLLPDEDGSNIDSLLSSLDEMDKQDSRGTQGFEDYTNAGPDTTPPPPTPLGPPEDDTAARAKKLLDALGGADAAGGEGDVSAFIGGAGGRAFTPAEQRQRALDATARAREGLAIREQDLAMTRARFEDWLQQLPLREQDRQDLRDRLARSEQRAIDAAKRAVDAANREVERLDMARTTFQNTLNKPFVAQPTPLPAPSEPRASANHLTWGDVAPILPHDLLGTLEDAWSSGTTGEEMLNPIRAATLMSSFPGLGNTPASLLGNLRKIWLNSGAGRLGRGTGLGGSRGRGIGEAPLPPALGYPPRNRPIRQIPSPRVL